MEESNVNIIVNEDKSVDKLIKKTAKKLEKKFKRSRKINEKLLKKQTPLQKTFSIIFDVFSAALIALCCYMCFCNIYAKINRTYASIFGYTNMYVATGSMVASGLDEQSIVIVRAVDAKSLSTGDVIAFYKPRSNVNYFIANQSLFISIEKLENPNNYKLGEIDLTKSTFAPKNDINTLLGIQSEALKKEAQKPRTKDNEPVIHHITEIFEAPDGKRWFKTRGSSNAREDDWVVCEDTIIGAYTETSSTKIISTVLKTISTPSGIIYCLIIPLILIFLMALPSCLKDVQLAMLELDIVEEKRKLTDDICVRNKIGYKMNTDAKFKVLANAPDDEKMLYVSLLWENGTAPTSIKKFYLKKEINLSILEKLRDLNRECEKMYKENVPIRKIAKYYNEEKAKIDKEEKEFKKTIKKLNIKYKKTKEII